MIDFYAFYGPWPYWGAPHTEPQAMLRLMAANHIDQAVICHTGSIFDDWRASNDAALQAALSDNRFIPFACLNPVIPAADILQLMQTYKRRGCKGIRLYPQHHHYSLTAPIVDEMLAAAAQLALPVVLSVRVIMQWGLPTLSTAEISDAVARHPGVQFVLSGANYGETRWLFELMQAAPNVSVEISGMEGFRAVQDALARVGAERILFGAGTPLQYPACSVAKLQVTRMSSAQEEAIRSGNARRLLGLV